MVGPMRRTVAIGAVLAAIIITVFSAPTSGALFASGPLGCPQAIAGDLVFLAGPSDLTARTANGHLIATVRRPTSPWPADIAACRVDGNSWLIAVLDGRPADPLDRLRFKGPWRSAPPRVGGRVTLYRFDRARETLAKVWDGPDATVNPWWVGFGDFTGAGRPGLLLGVWKTARFDPTYDRRPFIYGLYPADGGTSETAAGASGAGASAPGVFAPYPLWLGSRLSNPFTSLAVGDADGDGVDEIVAVTAQADGSQAISTYDWSGFGVVLGARVTGFQSLAAVSVIAPGRLAAVGRRSTVDPRLATGPGGSATPEADRLFLFRTTGDALVEAAVLPIPVHWNRPGGAIVTKVGGGETLMVRPDGRVTIAPAPGR